MIKSQIMVKKIEGTPDMVQFEEGDSFKTTDGVKVEINPGIGRVTEFPIDNLVRIQNLTINSPDQFWEVEVEPGTIEAFIEKAVNRSSERK